MFITLLIIICKGIKKDVNKILIFFLKNIMHISSFNIHNKMNKPILNKSKKYLLCRIK